jgi:hypothetical protein
MNSHICAIDESLKLCRTPTNALETIHVCIVERLDDGPNASNGFIDDSLMARSGKCPTVSDRPSRRRSAPIKCDKRVTASSSRPKRSSGVPVPSRSLAGSPVVGPSAIPLPGPLIIPFQVGNPFGRPSLCIKIVGTDRKVLCGVSPACAYRIGSHRAFSWWNGVENRWVSKCKGSKAGLHSILEWELRNNGKVTSGL